MKLEVFEYLVALEKYGSLNKAASRLYVSQPNLSNVLTSFEQEIGYPVIYRSHQGVRFTEKGKQVLLIAHNILKEKEKLMSINTDHHRLSLKISIGSGDFALTPLFEMLNEQDILDEVHVTIENCAVGEALEKVYQQLLDVAYFIIPMSMHKSILEYCHSHHLLLHHLKDMTCQINVREHHPILEHFSKESLWNYPFVDFVSQRPNAYDTYQQYINPQKIIEVDHHSLRRKIISETDAFSIGIPSSKQIKETYHLVGIPTPELKMQIFEVRKESDQNNPLLNRYYKSIEQALIEYE